MKTVFDSIFVNYAEYCYFKQLTGAERIDYLFDLYEASLIRQDGLDLSTFFETVKNNLDTNTDIYKDNKESGTVPEDVQQVDVMIDDTHIMVESNNLKALRYIIYKFVESGYILRRDSAMEKMFRKDKLTKYLRIFRIVDQTSSICTN